MMNPRQCLYQAAREQLAQCRQLILWAYSDCPKEAASFQEAYKLSLFDYRMHKALGCLLLASHYREFAQRQPTQTALLAERERMSVTIKSLQTLVAHLYSEGKS